MAGYTPDQLFAAYQTHLDRSNLTLTGIMCQVTMRRESRMWSGVSRGDDVSATVDVSPAQRRVLTGRVYYLCAIHAYADGHRGESLRFARLAAPHLPLAQVAVLLARCVVGPGVVGWLKKRRA